MAEALKQRLAHSGNKAATQRKVFPPYRDGAERDSLFCRHLPVMLTSRTTELRHGAVMDWRE